MRNRRVTLLGGSGFVGTQLTYRLASEFAEVVILTRHAQRVRPIKIFPNVDVVQTDVHDRAALEAALSGSDVVINLVGILNESGSQPGNSFTGAHQQLTATVLACCQAQCVGRYLHMSALNADAENGSSEYLKSKGRAEQLVLDNIHGLNWTAFQPSVIFGEHDAFFNRFAGLLQVLPVFPLACPEARMAPVYIGDVCQAIMDAIDNPATHDEVIQLCGPETYSLRELVQFAAQAAGLNRVVIGLPDWAAKVQARLMEWVPGKPFSRDNYLSLQIDSVCATGCSLQNTSIDAVVPRYLGNHDYLGRLQKTRRSARR